MEHYLKRLLFLLGILLMVFNLVPTTLYAQAMINLKMIDLKSGDTYSVGDYERGKIWIDREGSSIFLYDGESLKSYVLKDDVFMPLGDLSFEAGGLSIKKWFKEQDDKGKKEEKKQKKRLLPKFLWNMTLKEISLSTATTDVKGERLFIADLKGDIHVFNIKDRDYEGKLRFEKKAIRYIKALDNGGLLIIYDDSTVCYVERFIIPVFSILQDLKSSYVLKRTIRIPLKFISSFGLNKSQNRAILSGDHKDVIVINIPSLTYNKISEERLFIEFADFVADDAVIYMTLKAKGFTESTTTLRSHFTVMENYFDLRKSVIPSPSGRFLLRISEKESLDIYDLYEPSFLGGIGIDQKSLGDIYFGSDNRTFILTDRKKERITLYRLIEQQ
ncbi:MAG: hypothetical protein OHK0040_03030 [bacterium]